MFCATAKGDIIVFEEVAFAVKIKKMYRGLEAMRNSIKIRVNRSVNLSTETAAGPTTYVHPTVTVIRDYRGFYRVWIPYQTLPRGSLTI